MSLIKTKVIKIEIPEDTIGFTATYLFKGLDKQIHMISREYACNESDDKCVYLLPYNSRNLENKYVPIDKDQLLKILTEGVMVVSDWVEGVGEGYFKGFYLVRKC